MIRVTDGGRRGKRAHCPPPGRTVSTEGVTDVKYQYLYLYLFTEEVMLDKMDLILIILILVL